MFPELVEIRSLLHRLFTCWRGCIYPTNRVVAISGTNPSMGI